MACETSGPLLANECSFWKPWAWCRKRFEDRPGSGHVVQEFAPFFQESVAGHDGGTVLVAAHDQTTTPDQRFGCFSSSLVRVTNSLAAASASNCPWMVACFFTASSVFGTYGFPETGSVIVVVLFVGSPAIMVSSSFTKPILPPHRLNCSICLASSAFAPKDF